MKKREPPKQAKPPKPIGVDSRWCSRCWEWHPTNVKLIWCIGCAQRCERLYWGVVTVDGRQHDQLCYYPAGRHRPAAAEIAQRQRQHYPPHLFAPRLYRFTLPDGRIVERPVCFECHNHQLDEQMELEVRRLPGGNAKPRRRMRGSDDRTEKRGGNGGDYASNADAIVGLLVTGQTINDGKSSGVQTRRKTDEAPGQCNHGESWGQLQMELAYPAWAFDRWCEAHPKIAETFIANHAGVADLVSLWALTDEPRGRAYAPCYAIAKASDRRKFRSDWNNPKKNLKPRNAQPIAGPPRLAEIADPDFLSDMAALGASAVLSTRVEMPNPP